MKSSVVYSGALNLFVLFLTCLVLLSCSESAPPEDVETEGETVPETAEPAVLTPEDYAGLLPEEYSYLYTDIPQVIIESDGRPDTADYLPASITVVEYKDGKVDITKEENGEIRVRGNTSSATPKQQYGIRFPEKISLLGMDAGKRWVLNGSVFDKSLMRSKLVCDFSRQLRLPYASEGEYCDLWLNGRYRGNYLLIEPVTDGKGRVDINTDEMDFILECCVNRTERGVQYFTTPVMGIRFELDKPEKTDDAGMEYLLDFFAGCENAVMSLDHDQYGKFIDIGSFVDFYILNELVKDIDFGEFSTRFFIKKGVLYAGPPWDFDLAMGNVSYAEFKYLEYHNDVDADGAEHYDQEGDSAEGFWCRTGWYKQLFKDEYFHELIVKRYAELQPLITSLYYGESSVIDGYKEKYSASYTRNYDVWKAGVPYGIYENQNPKPTLDGNIGVLRRWLLRRNEWLFEHMSDDDVTPALHLLRPEYKPH